MIRSKLRRALRSGWLLLALAGCAGETPPNVILIVIDTLRADHLHGYGYARETSPNLDRLMAEGSRFDTALSNSSWSAPSHATIAGLTWGPLVPSIDVAPTILGLVGRAVPEWMDGRDLSGPLKSGRPSEEEVLARASYRHRGFDRYAVRSNDYKLIYDAVADTEELFDLRADPTESTNLLVSGSPGIRGDAERSLRDEMARHRAGHENLHPTKSRRTISPEAVKELEQLGYVEDEE